MGRNRKVFVLRLLCLFGLCLFELCFFRAQPAKASSRALPIPLKHASSKQIKYVVAGVENVLIFFPKGAVATGARVDTGATTSSLSATNIRLVTAKESTQRWVHFTFHDGSGKQHEVRLPLSRQGSIRSASNPRSTRHFVRAKVCLGGHLLEGEFSLQDRRHMNFPVLIGRNHLSGRFVVDVDHPPTHEYNKFCL